MTKFVNNVLCIALVLYVNACKERGDIVRGPYLNSVTSSSAVIRWRTRDPQHSVVSAGVDIDHLDKRITEEKSVGDHEVLLTGLQPDTKYYYSIGDAGKANADQYVVTAPPPGTIKPIRIWALGDFGNSSQNQLDCLAAVKKITKDRRPDVWIWLGDNAYEHGLDAEYQEHVFDVYQEYFSNTPVYPSPGNHEYRDTDHLPTIPYYSIFTMPQHGEAGGVASGSPAYYSVDYGNVHLVSMDSNGEFDGGLRLYDTLGNQVQWLKKDLAANKQRWTILFFHHPPYTKGSHDSDVEQQLVKLRENLIPIIERYHVDLVLCGHSHAYERTQPLKGHYGPADSFDSLKNVAAKLSSPNNYIVDGTGQGIIYVVNGSGGKVGGQSNGYPLKAAIYSNNTIGGSLLIDILDNRCNVRWVCSDGVVRDQFTITKE